MAWQEPPTINRAPGDLETIRAYINTVNKEHSRNLLSGPDQMRDWLAMRGLMRENDEVSKADFERGLLFRDALHRLALVNNIGLMDQTTLDVLKSITTDSYLPAQMQPDGTMRLEAGANGVDGAFVEMVGIVYAAMAEGEWRRLKVCKNEHCKWVFYDPSRNVSGIWCSMAICGSKTKSRMYRRRKEAEGRTED